MLEANHATPETENISEANLAQLLGYGEAEYAKLCSRELRRAAIHEACHATLLRRFGGCALPAVWPNDSQDATQRAWLGTCRVAEPGRVRFQRGLKKHLGIARTPKLWRVYVGLAGYVGERMADGDTEAWQILDSYLIAEDFGDISTSDLDMIDTGGHKLTERTIATTVRYLQRFWSDVERTAAELEDAAPYTSDPRVHTSGGACEMTSLWRPN